MEKEGNPFPILTEKRDPMQERPTIQQLQNFIIFGKVLNFATAASLANITQSAFSAQMRKLEDLVGVQLILRSNRGSILSPEGEFFLKRAQTLLDGLDDSIREVKDIAGQSMNLKVGTLMSMGDVLMNRHVSYFQQHAENIKIDIYNVEAQSMLQKLDAGELDVSTSFLLPQININNYVHKFFYTEELVYYAPNLGLKGATVDAATMASHPLATYSPDYYMSKTLHRYFTRQHLMPEVEARLSTPYAILHYCDSNSTGCLLSLRMLQEMNIKTGYFHLEEPLYFDCYLIYRRENPKLKSIEVFVDYILKLFGPTR